MCKLGAVVKAAVLLIALWLTSATAHRVNSMDDHSYGSSRERPELPEQHTAVTGNAEPQPRALQADTGAAGSQHTDSPVRAWIDTVFYSEGETDILRDALNATAGRMVRFSSAAPLPVRQHMRSSLAHGRAATRLHHVRHMQDIIGRRSAPC